jgi:hypothetical protein
MLTRHTNINRYFYFKGGGFGEVFYTHCAPIKFGKDDVSEYAQNEEHCVREHKFIYRISTHSLFSACISHFNENQKSYTSVGVSW